MTWLWLRTESDQLVFTPRDEEQPKRALRVDARAQDPTGDACWVSLCKFEDGTSIPFDDPSMSNALRHRLSLPWPGFVSTLLVDWSRVAGALTAAPTRAGLLDDPFARVFPQRVFHVQAGVLGTIPAPTGPAITRYGSGNPWPWDTYAGQVA